MIEIVYNWYKHAGLILQEYTKECSACQGWDFHFSCQIFDAEGSLYFRPYESEGTQNDVIQSD